MNQCKAEQSSFDTRACLDNRLKLGVKRIFALNFSHNQAIEIIMFLNKVRAI